MNGKNSAWRTYLFIRRNRFLKKKKIYKVAFDLMVDKTIAIYLLLFGGYTFAGIFIFGDFMGKFNESFQFIEENAEAGFWLILTALPIRYMMNAFSNPGLIFSSSEYQLTLLPYRREKIWLLALTEGLLKKLTFYAFAVIVILSITPLSLSFILSFILLFIMYDIIMAVPQWKLFQLSFLKKSGFLLAVLFINGIGIYTSSPWIGALLVGFIILINFGLVRSLFFHVNWGKVTETGDYTVWNMWLIGQASRTKFKRQKRYSIFKKTRRKKKPFISDKAIYNRLWKIYLDKNISLVFQFLGAFFVMLVVLIFINEWVFHLGVAVSIYSYAVIAVSFFRDRLEADIVQVLPWDITNYKAIFFKWVIAGGVILLIPVITYYSINHTYWLPMLLLLHSSTFVYLFQFKMNKEIRLLMKHSDLYTGNEGWGLLFIILVGFSGAYPVLSLSSLFIIFIIRKNMKYVH